MVWFVLGLGGCADPDPFADTVCSPHAPVDVDGWTRSYEPVAGGEFGEAGWRNTSTLGPEDFEGASAFAVSDEFEADYPTTDVYRISFRYFYTCDEQGTWLRGFTMSRHDEDGDQAFDQDSSLVLEQALMWSPSDDRASWDGSSPGVYTLGGQSYDVEWTVQADLLEEGPLELDSGTYEGARRLERRMGTEDSMSESVEWSAPGAGELLRENEWTLRELEVSG